MCAAQTDIIAEIMQCILGSDEIAALVMMGENPCTAAIVECGLFDESAIDDLVQDEDFCDELWNALTDIDIV